MQKPIQQSSKKGAVPCAFFACLLVVCAFAANAFFPLTAFATSPAIRTISQGQTEVSINIGEVEVFFGHNVSAGAVFDENASHFALYSEDGTSVGITVTRKYFGYGAPDSENPDPQGLRRYLYVSVPTLQPGTTYTLYVHEGVRAFGSLSYDGASVSFTTAGQAADAGEGEGSGGGSGSGSGSGAGDGSSGGSGSDGSGGSGNSGAADGGSSSSGGENSSNAEAATNSTESVTDAFTQNSTQEQAAFVQSSGSSSVEQPGSDVFSSPKQTLVKFASSSGLKSGNNGDAGGGGAGDESTSTLNTAEASTTQQSWFLLVCLLVLLVGMGIQKSRRAYLPQAGKRIDKATFKKE